MFLVFSNPSDVPGLRYALSSQDCAKQYFLSSFVLFEKNKEMGIRLLGQKLMLMSKKQELKATLGNNGRTVTEALMPGKKRKQSSKILSLAFSFRFYVF